MEREESSNISTLLRDCLLNRDVQINPGEDIRHKIIETDLKRYAQISDHERAVLDSISGSEKKRIDSPLRNIYIRIFHDLYLVGNYFAGLFEIKTNNKKFKSEFKMIWNDLIRNWYFGEVYIGYGEDILKLDEELARRKRKNLFKIKRNCRFRLYTKQGESESRFRSYYSGEIISSKKMNERRLVYAGLINNNHWMYWWHILVEYYGGRERVIECFKASSKRTIVNQSSSDTMTNSEESQLDNDSCLYRVTTTSKRIMGNESEVFGANKYNQHEFFPPEKVNELFRVNNNLFNSQTDKLGYSGKQIDEKKARLTQQESFLSVASVSVYQDYLRDELQNVFEEMRMVYGASVIPKDLKIIISNRSTAGAILEEDYEFGYNMMEKQAARQPLNIEKNENFRK